MDCDSREVGDDSASRTMFIFAANDGAGGGLVTSVLGKGLLAMRGSVEVVSETPVRTIALAAGSDRFSDTSNALDVAVYKMQVQLYLGEDFK